MKTSPLFALPFAVAVALGAAAQGQTTSPPTAPAANAAGAHAWGPQGQRGPGGENGMWKKRQAARATALHNVLGIRPDQEAAFQAYALPPHPAMAGGPGGQGWRKPGGRWPATGAEAPMTAPERADAMLERFDNHIARMRERLAQRAAAVKTLYAALTPDQRRVFDALPQLRGHGGGEEGGWGRHDGGGRGPHGPGEGMGE